MQINTEVHARGPTRNSGLPPREGDPWIGNPVIRKLMKRADLPEPYAVTLAKYIQLSALIEWGGIGYEGGSLEETARELQALPIHESLGVNLHILGALLQSSEDLLIRMLQGPDNKEILLAGIDGLMDTDRIEMHVITPLVRAAARTEPPATLPVRIQNGELYAWLQEHGLAAISMHSIQTLSDAVACILQGDLLILVDGFAHGLFASLRGWAERAISESTTEPAMRAPKEAFNESIRTMTALVRRRMRSPHLRIERYLIGVESPTAVDLLFVQGLTSPDLVHEARARLQRIQVDRLKTAGMLEELLEDQPSAFFPQFLTTERPDRVASYLMEGKIAFLIDGEQNAKLAPVSFVHFLSAP
ncbi:MAG TPA: spore germination protein, partial [Symbiobacteriaceae bacterium]|nr:spore germination protein [Symbiobacteriaceae bacterium]